MAMASVLITVWPGPMDELPEFDNPLSIEALKPVIGVTYAFTALLPFCIGACAASLIGRFRRSGGRQRLQLKWLAAAAATTALVYLLAMAASLLTLSNGSWFTGPTPAWLGVLQNVAIYSFVLSSATASTTST
jgi:hypothetical protein